MPPKTWQDSALEVHRQLCASFGIPAVFMGRDAIEHTALVLFSSPGTDILGGSQISDEYAIDYAPADLPGLLRGADVTVSGLTYTVREIHLSEDGFTCHATLKR